MRHPFQAVDDGLRLRASLVLAVVALAVRWKMRVRAKSKEAPHGMMSLAFVDCPPKARRIVGSWDRSVRHKADLNLRLDPVFSLTWTNAICLAGFHAARELREQGGPGTGLAVPLAWSQWLAALLAIVKDCALLALLRGRRARWLPPVARWSAAIEIGIKALGLAYAAAGVLARRAGRPGADGPPARPSSAQRLSQLPLALTKPPAPSGRQHSTSSIRMDADDDQASRGGHKVLPWPLRLRRQFPEPSPPPVGSDGEARSDTRSAPTRALGPYIGDTPQRTSTARPELRRDSRLSPPSLLPTSASALPLSCLTSDACNPTPVLAFANAPEGGTSMVYKATRDAVQRVIPLLDRLASRSIDKALLLQYLSARAGEEWGVLELVEERQSPGSGLGEPVRTLHFRDCLTGTEHAVRYPRCLPVEIEPLACREYQRLVSGHTLSVMERPLFDYFFAGSFCSRCRWRGDAFAQFHTECLYAGTPINFEPAHDNAP